MTPTAADVDELDAAYLHLAALAASKAPPISDSGALMRHRAAGLEVGRAAQRLCEAITDHDIAAYGEPFPEEESPCPTSPASP